MGYRKLAAVFLLLSACVLRAENLITVESTSGLVGEQDVSVRILISNDDPVEGFSFAGSWDPGLAYDHISIEGTDLDSAGYNAEYVDLIEESEYFAAVVIIDFEAPYDARTIPAGEDHYVLAAFFDIPDDAVPGTDLTIDVEDGTGGISAVFTVDGQSVHPQTVDGVISVRLPPPSVVSISPVRAPTAGGTEVTITGENLTADTEVLIGGELLSEPVFVDSQTITGKAPAHEAGTVGVTVRNQWGSATLEDAFSYVSPPEITAVTPSSGPGGVTVTITGSNFTDSEDTEVFFGASAASEVQVGSPEELTCRMPPCDEEGTVFDVTVRTTGGEAVLQNAYECVGGTLFKRGDANADGELDISDAIFLLSYLFGSGRIPRCEKAGDANGDGTIDLGDVVRILGFLFRDTGDLPAPFGSCGTDDQGLSADLSCESYPPCE